MALRDLEASCHQLELRDEILAAFALSIFEEAAQRLKNVAAVRDIARTAGFWV